MQNAHELMSRLNQSGRKLSKSHRRIAEYIVAHYDKAAFMTAAKLGEYVGISESTVVRFASALGYEGYPQLQKALQELIRHRLTATQRFEMASDLDDAQVLGRVLRADMQNIRTTIDELDNAQFMEAVTLFLNARRIYVMGLRASAPLADFFGHYLGFIFPNVTVVSAGISDVFEQISRIGAQDLLLGISFPRYSTRTLQAMRLARCQGARVIALTDGPLSPLKDVSNTCLTAKSDMTSFVDSLAAPMSVLNALIVALGLRRKEELTARFDQLERIWGVYDIYLDRERDGRD